MLTLSHNLCHTIVNEYNRSVEVAGAIEDVIISARDVCLEGISGESQSEDLKCFMQGIKEIQSHVTVEFLLRDAKVAVPRRLSLKTSFSSECNEKPKFDAQPSSRFQK